jgi:hypothetical protein
VRKAWTFWTGRNDRRFRDERDEEFRQWTVEHALALHDLLRRMGTVESDVAALQARLERLADDHEFQRVQGNYGWEAWREATDERKRMLAFAAAGSYTVDLTVPQIARVERTIRELDPADVDLLRALTESESHTDQVSAERAMRERNRVELWRQTQPSGDILVAAGCVRNVYDIQDVLHVTDLGHWVLQVLDGYLRAQQPDKPTPPQEATP